MRLDIDSFREIADSLSRNKSRSFLTGFGVFWGIFMLLVLIGGGKGLDVLMSKQAEGFATNTSVLWSQNTSLPYKGMREGRWWDLEYKDVDRLKEHFPELDVVTPIKVFWGNTVSYDSHTISCNLKGVTQDYSKIEEPKLKYGRYLNAIDVEQRRKVCVLGKRIYNSLFPEGGDPCGKSIIIGSSFFQVIGVDFNSGNININGRADESVMLPITTAQAVFNSGGEVSLICMTGKNSIMLSYLSDQIRGVIAREHMVDPNDKEAIQLVNTEEMFLLVSNLFKGLNFLIWLVGLGTLLAGVIGVSNIMMVTVRERTIEIGIRRAIGATPKEILSQIICESITLTLVSGFLGILFSVLVLNGIEMIAASSGSPAPFQIKFGMAVGASLFLALLGVIAGLAPALRAMKIKPVDAMRDE